MTVECIEQEFQEQVSEKIRLVAEDMNRFRVFTPFVFDDGDHLAVVLRREDAGWVLSDEAHTYMRLTPDIDGPDPHKETRQKIIASTLSVLGIEDRGGELILTVRDSRYADALYSFIQGLLQVATASYLFTKLVKS